MHMATASIAARKPFRVLLIDDEEQIAKLLNQGLQSPGVEFFFGNADASTGYERACALRPNLILLDLGLPDADGMDVLDRLLHGESESGGSWYSRDSIRMRRRGQKGLAWRLGLSDKASSGWPTRQAGSQNGPP